jgi:RimJ/RimL family protein N-acetyltransferase
MTVEVRLRPMPLATATALLSDPGSDRADPLDDGPAWHPDYPLTDTIVGLRLLMDAHRLAGWDGSLMPRWWIHQIVADGEVVGDIGFHGPASEDGTVEIGYALVEAVHGRGIATAACADVLEKAWSDGARTVIAETEPDNVASRRVLIKNGFRPRPDGLLEIRR